MECEVVQAHLPDCLARTLAAPVAADVDAHLRTCDRCAAEYAEIEETWQRLRTVPAAGADSASMRSRFEGGLNEYVLEHQSGLTPRRGETYYGLQLAAGPLFAPEGGLDRFVRLPFSQSPERLTVAVERLAEAWDDLPTGVPSRRKPTPALVT